MPWTGHFSEKQFSFTKRALTSFARGDYKGARLMNDLFILRIKNLAIHLRSAEELKNMYRVTRNAVAVCFAGNAAGRAEYAPDWITTAKGKFCER